MWLPVIISLSLKSVFCFFHGKSWFLKCEVSKESHKGLNLLIVSFSLQTQPMFENLEDGARPRVLAPLRRQHQGVFLIFVGV